MQAHIMSLHRPLTRRVGSKYQNIFLNVVMLDIKLKGRSMDQHRRKKY